MVTHIKKDKSYKVYDFKLNIYYSIMALNIPRPGVTVQMHKCFGNRLLLQVIYCFDIILIHLIHFCF